jgi:hypothetical protein
MSVTNIPIRTVAGVIDTQFGPVVAVFHNYAYLGRGKTIHSALQLASYFNDVNDRHRNEPTGLSRIVTCEGYVIPLSYRHGMPELDIQPYTEGEWDDLPHVVMTDPREWDPHRLDYENNDEAFFNTVPSTPIRFHRHFDDRGDYLHRHVTTHRWLRAHLTDSVICDHSLLILG